MRLARTPLRVTLGGGGTDLPTNPDGFAVTATINRYIYGAVSQPFTDEIVVHHHAGTERVQAARELDHRLLREILHGTSPVEYSGISEIPAGTGLGSSSAFTVTALHALHAHRDEYRTRAELATEACDIEVRRLGDPIGYQDQFACALGGLRWLAFQDGHVTTKEIHTDHPVWAALNQNLRLLYTGISRSAADQMGQSPDLLTLREQGLTSCKALQAGDLPTFARGLTEQWEAKFDAAPTDVHRHIDTLLTFASGCGADGGKLVGAGNGGFLLIYAHPDVDLTGLHLREIPIQLTTTGTELVG